MTEKYSPYNFISMEIDLEINPSGVIAGKVIVKSIFFIYGKMCLHLRTDLRRNDSIYKNNLQKQICVEFYFQFLLFVYFFTCSTPFWRKSKKCKNNTPHKGFSPQKRWLKWVIFLALSRIRNSMV